MAVELIHELAAALAGRGIVVVDAAYAEFAAADPTAELLDRHENIIVLRTLSKARSLAGVRCGALLATPELVTLLGCVLPPYTFPTLCAEAVEHCLDPQGTTGWQLRIEQLKAERLRLAVALAGVTGIRRVWPSDANFLLVEAANPAHLMAAAQAGGVLLRDFSWDPYLTDCIRITVGASAENEQLLNALAQP